MRLVEFVSFEVENFKSFIGKHTLDVSAYADGLHFIKGKNKAAQRLGSNGSGKSTMWADAPAWCFYGRTVSGLRGTDVRPWGKKAKSKTTAVITRLLIDGKKHRITRSVNPSLLLIDGKDASQEAVERLIGMSLVTFANTVMLGQGQPLFFDLKPRDKMALFVDALSLGKWDDRSKAASARVTELSLDVANIEGEITGLQASLESLESYIKAERDKADAWEKDRRKDLKRAQANLEVLAKLHTAAQKARDTADLALEAAETERRHYERKLPDAEEALLKADKALQAEEARINEVQAKLIKANREIRELGDGDRCAHCGQSLKGTALEKHRKELQRRIKALKREVGDGVRPSVTQKAEAANVQMRHMRQMQRRFTDEAIQARDTLESKERLFAQAQAQIESARKAIADHEGQRNPHTATVNQLNKRIRKQQRDIDSATEELRSIQVKAKRAAFWVKGFKDVRVFVLEEVLDELELTTNAMLADAGLVDWRVSFSLEREGTRGSVFGLNVMIESPVSAGRVKWESWSGGEAQRLRLVSALALKEVLLNRAGVDPVLEVIDEPTRGLSPEGVADLIDYLADRAKRLRLPIFLIDHMARESARFASVTTVVRDAAGSRLQAP